MSKFTATFEFESHAGEHEANAWFDTLMLALPEGSTGKLVHHPYVMAVDDLTDEHLGNTVTIHVPDEGEVTGILEFIYPAGRHGVGRTLIIDGTAHTVNFGVVQISGW